MKRARRLMLLLLGASGCWGLKACDPPRPGEDLPVKLFMCSARRRHCEVVARFNSSIDCNLYRKFLGSECDPDAGPEELHCWQTKLQAYRREYFHECTDRDLAFEDVRDGGGWIR